ncbi:hypothetical protein HDU81_006644, partial [Chytriomyces hyalinus]
LAGSTNMTPMMKTMWLGMDVDASNSVGTGAVRGSGGQSQGQALDPLLFINTHPGSGSSTSTGGLGDHSQRQLINAPASLDAFQVAGGAHQLLHNQLLHNQHQMHSNQRMNSPFSPDGSLVSHQHQHQQQQLQLQHQQQQQQQQQHQQHQQQQQQQQQQPQNNAIPKFQSSLSAQLRGMPANLTQQQSPSQTFLKNPNSQKLMLNEAGNHGFSTTGGASAQFSDDMQGIGFDSMGKFEPADGGMKASIARKPKETVDRTKSSANTSNTKNLSSAPSSWLDNAQTLSSNDRNGLEKSLPSFVGGAFNHSSIGDLGTRDSMKADSLFGGSDVLSPSGGDGEEDLLSYTERDRLSEAMKARSLLGSSTPQANGFSRSNMSTVRENEPEFSLDFDPSTNSGDGQLLDFLNAPLQSNIKGLASSVGARLQHTPRHNSDGPSNAQFGLSLPRHMHHSNSIQFSNSFHDFGFYQQQPPSGRSDGANFSQQNNSAPLSAGSIDTNNMDTAFQDMMVSSSTFSDQSPNPAYYSSSVPNNVLFGAIQANGNNAGRIMGSSGLSKQFLPGSYGSEDGYNMMRQQQMQPQLSVSLGGLPPHMIFTKQGVPNRRAGDEGNRFLNRSAGGHEDGNHNDPEDFMSAVNSAGAPYQTQNGKNAYGQSSSMSIPMAHQQQQQQQPFQRNSYSAESRFLHQPKSTVGSVGSASTSLMDRRLGHLSWSPHPRRRRSSVGSNFDETNSAGGEVHGDGQPASLKMSSPLQIHVEGLSNGAHMTDGSNASRENSVGSPVSGGVGVPEYSSSLNSNHAPQRSLLSVMNSANSSALSSPALGTSPIPSASAAASAAAASSAGAAGRNFVCTVCSKPFMRRQDLRRHEQTHLGVKAFSCPLGCGTNFSRSDALQRHLKARRFGMIYVSLDGSAFAGSIPRLTRCPRLLLKIGQSGEALFMRAPIPTLLLGVTQRVLFMARDQQQRTAIQLSSWQRGQCSQRRRQPLLEHTPMLWGVPLKHLSLLTLVVQNSMLVIVMKYSRKAKSNGPYLASTAVLLSELTKFIICFVLHLRDRTSPISRNQLYADLLGPESEAWKMMVPAALYVIQNNLQYLAVTNLDPATFQVSYQMKILTTAVFSVLMLKKTLTRLKWLSLVLLTFGIALVQIPSDAGKEDSEITGLQSIIGLTAVAIACVLSGLAGVWFEKVLKGSKASLWVRNTQLSFFSLIPAFLGVYFMDGAAIAENGFFQGYTAWTFGAISCQAIGGLIVALVVKYADNILKGFATSISIILSAIASVFLFDFHISAIFCVGSTIVLYGASIANIFTFSHQLYIGLYLTATHLYGLPDPIPIEYTKVKNTQDP